MHMLEKPANELLAYPVDMVKPSIEIVLCFPIALKLQTTTLQ